MSRIISLRAHHLMCLPGYRGLNYGEEAKNNWDSISQLLKAEPETKVQIAKGRDTLCLRCPHSAENTCQKEYVSKLDETIQKLLEIKIFEIYNYSELSAKIRDILDSKKHAEICGDCTWRAYGVCKDTFKKVAEACGCG